MTKVGGQFTTEKRNLVTYIENKYYEQLRQLARLNGRSVSAEAAAAIRKHLKEHAGESRPLLAKSRVTVRKKPFEKPWLKVTGT